MRQVGPPSPFATGRPPRRRSPRPPAASSRRRVWGLPSSVSARRGPSASTLHAIDSNSSSGTSTNSTPRSSSSSTSRTGIREVDDGEVVRERRDEREHVHHLVAAVVVRQVDRDHVHVGERARGARRRRRRSSGSRGRRRGCVRRARACRRPPRWRGAPSARSRRCPRRRSRAQSRRPRPGGSSLPGAGGRRRHP